VRTRATSAPSPAERSTNTRQGELYLTLFPEREGVTRIHIRASAGKDNIYAAARDPNVKMIEIFKSGLSQAPAPAPPAREGEGALSAEIERLVALRREGTLSEAEFQAIASEASRDLD
jgi:hypothetical protein